MLLTACGLLPLNFATLQGGADLELAPCASVQEGGTLHVATGTWTRPAPSERSGGTDLVVARAIYDNTCATGSQYTKLLEGGVLVDTGRIPSPSAPEGGTTRRYFVTSFEFSYCTYERDISAGGQGATVRVRFFDDLDHCMPSTAGAGVAADLLLSGLPGSPAQNVQTCWVVTADLAGGNEFCLRADANGVHNGVPGRDTFGFALEMPNQTGTTIVRSGGFVLAGTSACPEGDGTFYQNPGAGTGTGLDDRPGFYREGAGKQTSGCIIPAPVPYRGFHMRIHAELSACGVCPGAGDPDADGDGAPDCVDGCPSDPAKTAPGQCGCGVPDLDDDSDGTVNCLDACPNDPAKVAPGQCGCGVPDTDTDLDGTANCLDGCPNDPAKVAPGQCGCGVADLDSDGDGTANCIDGCPNDPAKVSPGICGCGTSDVDTDLDGAADCVDGCPNDPAKTSPGTCGCGVADVDTDQDGVFDCHDNCDDTSNPSQADCDGDGVGDACALANGAPDCNLNSIPDACDIFTGTSQDQNANAIPDECEGPDVAYCFGDGTNGPCPCGNLGATGHGCANSIGSAGAQLGSSGAPRLQMDTLVFVSTGEPGASLTIFLQGSVLIGPIQFGDGLRCTAGTLKRLYIKHAVGGVAIAPRPGDLTVSARSASLGDPLQPGQKRFYLAFYRDPSLTFCAAPAGGTFNASNGRQIEWQ